MKIKILVLAIIALKGLMFGQSDTTYPLVTLHDINYPVDSSGKLPPPWPPPTLLGDTVRVRGTVTVSPLVDPILNRTPVLYSAAGWQGGIQEDDSSPWSGLSIYQSDSTFKGTLFDLCDTAKTYEFTGVVSQYGASPELNLLNYPVKLISSQIKRPVPITFIMDSCFTSGGLFNINLIKYNNMYVQFVSDSSHPLIVSGYNAHTFHITDNNGHNLDMYGQSTFYRSPKFTPPSIGTYLSYIRGLLQAYQPSKGWIWEIIPLYPGDIKESSTSISADKQVIPTRYVLNQNYPNPFNPSTTISFSIAKAGNVKLTIYNAIGSKVATVVNEYKNAGNYSVPFNGSNLASGIYLYRLESGNYSAAKKFILLK